MKTLFLVLTVILTVSCYELTSTATSSNPPKSPARQSNAELSNQKAPRLSLFASNEPFVHDLVVSAGKIIGVGTGAKSPSDELFVMEEGSTNRWVGQPLDELTNSFVDAKDISLKAGTLWLAASGGVVMKKPESGCCWENLTRVPSAEATFISFADSTVGYVLARAFNKNESGLRVFKTSDGGRSWTRVLEDLRAGNPFDLVVVDRKTVIVAMNDEYILRTSDGGDTWAYSEITPRERKIDRSDWIKLNDSGASDLELFEDTVWVVGERGSFYSSTDHGKTWSRPQVLPELLRSEAIRSIAFSSSGNGVAVGENGLIIGSNDRGKTWFLVPENVTTTVLLDKAIGKGKENLHSVKFVDDTAMILGERGVYTFSF